MLKENHLNLRMRRNIYNYILKHPGRHYREIAKSLKLHKNTISYHIDYLIKKELIVKSCENGFTRYYAKKLEGESAQTIAKALGESIPYESESRIYRIFRDMNPGKRDKEVINILRQDTALEIIKLLLVHPELSQRVISSCLKKHHSTVSYYLKRLIEKDVIEEVPVGKRIRYRIKDEEYIFKIYRIYFGMKEKLNSDNDPTGKTDYFMMDSMIERLLDVLPIPFCAGYSTLDKRKKK